MKNKSKQELINRFEELKKIPLYDVNGGRQRSSIENEEYEKLKVILKKLSNAQ